MVLFVVWTISSENFNIACGRPKLPLNQKLGVVVKKGALRYRKRWYWLPTLTKRNYKLRKIKNKEADDKANKKKENQNENNRKSASVFSQNVAFLKGLISNKLCFEHFFLLLLFSFFLKHKHLFSLKWIVVPVKNLVSFIGPSEGFTLSSNLSTLTYSKWQSK